MLRQVIQFCIKYNKCNNEHPAYAIELRDKYESVTPGFHSNKKHWNTIFVNREIEYKKIYYFINHSYELVVAGLPKKLRDEIKKEAN